MIHPSNWAGVDRLADFIAALVRNFRRSEGHTGLGMNGRSTGQLLPSPNRAIDKARLDFDQSCAPSRSLRSDQCGAGAAEWIEDDAVQIGAIPQRVRNQCHRLHSRMQRELPLCAVAQRILPGIVPNVGTIPSEAAEFDVVDVGGLSFL